MAINEHRVFRRIAFDLASFDIIKQRQRELEALASRPYTLAEVISIICNEHKDMKTSEERRPTKTTSC